MIGIYGCHLKLLIDGIKFYSLLKFITLPRHYLLDYNLSDVVELELHGVSEASLKAAAAVVYRRAVLPKGLVFTSLVAAKTKIAPCNNKLTIPKLELIGCLILSKLVKSIKDSLENVYVISDLFCWTDDLDCVYWINNSSKLRGKFVESRVSKLRCNVKDLKWCH